MAQVRLKKKVIRGIGIKEIEVTRKSLLLWNQTQMFKSARFMPWKVRPCFFFCQVFPSFSPSLPNWPTHLQSASEKKKTTNNSERACERVWVTQCHFSYALQDNFHILRCLQLTYANERESSSVLPDSKVIESVLDVDDLAKRGNGLKSLSFGLRR